ncbi:hypothetical protein RJZ56_000719 [Blastomyces dermatitidis]|uniref:Rhodanese domain-containing protein n=4 Tax=Blastomyces TaxID=229219 RepID=A0A179UTP9_BLAGS|nr:uncharacterized protein BDBG_06968 [Blastomyces gilchristii SLH14081]XP_045278454.1 uncharacterized protein BDCG_07159 [Blastomyces dermatitidis ER-3]EGE78695.1 hypothetical protein BDDG_01632 [Blastomyces dermatitidis ATCC 18188]EQL35328.1 hypothetical protein BDFG_02842 [Blastomyces dermatitidis ATCC 26199]EEQ92039.1 hypothetical protein BDCG_07159 [Blastomyces dermatitidis ER-3]OAT11495.1 hypothetical protein BDBG_06968 [Blastomyces gilchristii SLH14081]
MSRVTIANLPRMSRDTLAAMLLTPTNANTLAIVDVRDSDHVGGHIFTSTWQPSATLGRHMPELINSLRDKEKVVFHCALSQERGPSAALKYIREREQVLGKEESAKQTVFVLDGGFVRWQEKYGEDQRLTQGYVKDIWED